jgi:hypothetical protein
MFKILRIAVAASLLALVAPASALELCSHGMVDHGSAHMLTHDNGLTRSDFDLLGTAWDPGAGTSRVQAGPAPGGATWSIMGAGFVDVSTFDPDHVGATQNITALGVAGWIAADYVNMINAAMDVWAAASDFTNLGQVADGGVNAGAAEAAGGGLGDIRIAAWEILASTTLAHAFQPGDESIFGAGGSIAGDLHMDVNRNWTDDAGDVTGNGAFDIFTVMLHELGHALGLGHSAVVGSVMEPIYAGSRRTLHADDIAGIQAIYGPPGVEVPAPGTLWLLGMGLLALGWSRRRTS